MTLTPFAAAGVLVLAIGFSSPAFAQTCTYSFTGDGQATSDGGTLRTYVDAQPDTCTWSFVVTAFNFQSMGRIFATEAPGGSAFVGDGYVEIVYGPHRTPGTKFSSLLFLGEDGFSQSLNYVQTGFGGCIYTASPSDAVVPNEGARVTITVSQFNEFLPTVPCTWSGTASDVAWIVTPTNAQGSNAAFDVSVAPNPTAYTRYGSVSVAGRVVRIAQEGTRPVRNVDVVAGAGADVLTYDPATGRYDIFALGAGGVHQRADYFTFGAQRIVEAGDFNGDTLTDFVAYDPATGDCIVNSAAWPAPTRPGVLAGIASGGCAPGLTDAVPTILDANGDGVSDIFLYNPVTGAWTLNVTNTGAGFPFTEVASGIWANGWEITAGRFDGDNRDDLFLYNANPAHPYGGRWFLVLTREGGAFEYIAGDLRWAAGWKIVPGDFDGDGRTELFLHGYANTGMWFIVDFVNGTSTYSGGVWAAGWQVFRAEFNGDGRTDLLLYHPGPGALAGMWFRVLSDGAGGFTYVLGEMRWAAGWRISVGDIDADGLSDVFLDGRADGLAAEVLTRSAGLASHYVYHTGWPLAPVILMSRKVTP